MNNQETLSATLESISSQTYTNLEIIVLDDASDDNSFEVMERFAEDSRFSFHESELRLGIPGSWNAVSKLARGEYVKLVCADDRISPSLVARQVQILQEFPDVGFVSCNRVAMEPSSGISVRLRSPWKNGRVNRWSTDGARAIRWGRTPFGEPMCVLARRSLLESVGFWESDFPLAVDLDTLLRMFERSHHVHIGSNLAVFLLRPNQHSYQKLQSLWHDHYRLLRWHADRLPSRQKRVHSGIGLINVCIRLVLKQLLRKILRLDVAQP